MLTISGLVGAALGRCTGVAVAVMSRLVRILAGDASALFPLASPSPTSVSSLIPIEHPSEAAAAAAAAAAEAADAAAATSYINGGGFYRPVTNPSASASLGCGDWQLLDQKHQYQHQQQHHHQQQQQQDHQVLSYRTGWARGLRIAPMLKDVPLGVGGEFDDGSNELVAVVWNDLGVEREELVGMSVGHA